MKTKAIAFLALTILVGAFFMLGTGTAMAKCGEWDDEPQAVEEPPPPPSSLPTPMPEETPPPSPVAEPPPTTGNPFTPDGVATVIDNATSDDGKEFFTITTPAGNVFFLVIDRSRPQNNVYFLNAVTEQDLMALAVRPEETPPFSPIPEPLPTPEPEDDPTEADPYPEPEQGEPGNNGTVIFAIIAALAFGGAAYYLKIVRPKKQAAAFDDDEDEYEEDEDFDTEDEEDDEMEEIYDVDKIIREYRPTGDTREIPTIDIDDEEEKLFDEIQ